MVYSLLQEGFLSEYSIFIGFVWASQVVLVVVVKNPSASVGGTRDLGLIPGLGRSGIGNGNSLQYSCLKNSTEEPDRLQSMGCIESGVTEYNTHEENLLQHRERYSVLCGGLNGKEIRKRANICICVADSLCCTAETNTTV